MAWATRYPESKILQAVLRPTVAIRVAVSLQNTRRLGYNFVGCYVYSQVFLSLLLVWNVGILSNAEALSGFNNPGMIVIGALFVVVSAIEKSSLADKAAHRILGLTTTFNTGFCRLMLCALGMSAFTNNTPVVALLLPVAQRWARTRGFDPAVLLMPLSFVSAFGGILTTVGGGTNLLIQGLLYEAGKSDTTIRPFRLFEPAIVGLPPAIIGIVFLLFAAPRMLGKPDHVGGGRSPQRDAEDLGTEVEVTEDFDLIGKPFALTLAVLGLPEHVLVKVRRPIVNRVMEPTALARTGNANDISTGSEDAVKSDTGSWSHLLGERASATAKTLFSGASPVLPRRVSFDSRLSLWYRRLKGNGGEDQLEKARDIDVGPCLEMAAVQVHEDVNATTVQVIEDPSRDSHGTGVVGSCWKDGCIDKNTKPFEDIYQNSPRTNLRAGDILVIACDQEAMMRLHGSAVSRRKRGLNILGVSALALPRHGTVFSKLVLSRSSKFLGRVARLDNAYFGAAYDCIVVAFRLKGSTGVGVDLIGGAGGGSAGDDSSQAAGACSSPSRPYAAKVLRVESEVLLDGDGARNGVDSPFVSHAPTPLLSSLPPGGDACASRRRTGEAFEPGDTVMVLAKESFSPKTSPTRAEFLRSERIGSLPESTGWFHFFPLLVFAAMLVWVLVTDVGMTRAAFSACAVLILMGWVDASRAVGCINWRLLVLMGSALGFSKAIANSGLAERAGVAIRDSGMTPFASLLVLFGFTMMCSELISNAAAAALSIPIALSIARELETDYRPFAMAVLVAASCSFLTPIGTPTNIMVWGPGGYKFQDYAKLGAPLSLMFLGTCAAIPLVFPF